MRDIGGLIVIDFIDMAHTRNQRQVEDELRDSLEVDRARVQIGRISRFGLLEMSRQRLRPALGETSREICPRCSGQGAIRGVESLALAIMRLLEEEAMKEKTSSVVVQAPVKVANFLLNEKRQLLAAIEGRHGISVVVVANDRLETPSYKLRRLRVEDETEESAPSYELTDAVSEESAKDESRTLPPPPPEQPAVSSVTPARPAPAPRRDGIFKKLAKWFGFGSPDPEKKAQGERSHRRPPPRKSYGSRGKTQKKPARRSRTGNESGQRRRGSGQRSGDSQAASNTARKKTSTSQTAGENTRSPQSEAQARSSSRRGRRGGRRRRSDAPKSDSAGQPERAGSEATGGNVDGNRDENRPEPPSGNREENRRETSGSGQRRRRPRRASSDSRSDSSPEPRSDPKPELLSGPRPGPGSESGASNEAPRKSVDNAEQPAPRTSAPPTPAPDKPTGAESQDRPEKKREAPVTTSTPDDS